jgi:hypothetical protein
MADMSIVEKRDHDTVEGAPEVAASEHGAQTRAYISHNNRPTTN